MEKMGLIVFEKTGHVLAAFTRQGDPEGTIEAEAVAGEGIDVRDETTGGRLLTLETRYLKVEIVDREDRVLLDWRRYLLDEGETSEGAPGVTASVDGMRVTVNLPAAPAEPVEAWVQVEGGTLEDPVVDSVEIPVSGPSGSTPLALGSGDYRVLALVPGFHGVLTRVTLP